MRPVCRDDPGLGRCFPEAWKNRQEGLPGFPRMDRSHHAEACAGQLRRPWRGKSAQAQPAALAGCLVSGSDRLLIVKQVEVIIYAGPDDLAVEMDARCWERGARHAGKAGRQRAASKTFAT
jgi:hypothetical protein